MDITISIDALRNAIVAAEPVTKYRPPRPLAERWQKRPPRPPAPDLVMLSTNGADLDVVAGDKDMTIATAVPCSIAAAGWATARASRLLDLLDCLPGGEARLVCDGSNVVTFHASGVTGQLDVFVVGEPPIAAIDTPAFMPIAAAALAKLLDRTQFALCRDESRYHLNGIRLEQSHGAQTIDLVGVLDPVVTRSPADPSAFSVTMPVRLAQADIAAAA